MSEYTRPEVYIGPIHDAAIKEYIEQCHRIVNMYGTDVPIILNINSPGGNLYSMALFYNFLKTLHNPIFTLCSSHAMSAAAIILATCAKKGRRYATPMSSIMVHELSSGSIGNITGLEDDINNLKQENEKWMKILAGAMGLKKKSIRQLIRERTQGNDLYLTPEEALELGIIDHIGSLVVNLRQNLEILEVKPDSK
jgi:ATP-dependent Clp protease protease subunit